MSHSARAWRGGLALPLVLLLLAGGTGLVLASHDPDFIHVCIKNRNIKIVRDGAKCQRGAASMSLATEASLASLQNENAALQARVDELESLAKRLHGHQAAVVERGSSNSGIPGMPGGFVIRFSVCAQGMLDPNGVCSGATGYQVETPILTEADHRSVVTFDASNTPDFPAMAALLTNGEIDIVRMETQHYDSNGMPGGGGSSQTTDANIFYYLTQVTSGPGYTDLEGLDLGSISISIDRLTQFYDQPNDKSSSDLDYRIFFGLAP